MSNLQDKVTDLVGKSSGAGKKVYNATMYIPSMALELSGNVVVSAKDFVFALHKVLKFWTVGMINISTVIIYLQDQHNTKNVLKAQSCNSKFLFLSFQNAQFYLL